MKIHFRLPMTATAAIFLVGMGVSAQSWGGVRNVIVNGDRVDVAQLAFLDQMHCMPIPNGNYFLTHDGAGSWAWGYAALPGVVQGYLGEECSRGSGGRYANTGYSGDTIDYGWSEDYSRTYGGGISAGDGTYEYFDGASGSFNYE